MALSGQVLGEELIQRVERKQLDPVAQVDVARAWDDEALLGLGGRPVGVSGEVPGWAFSPVTNRIGRDEIHLMFVSSRKFMKEMLLVLVHCVTEFGW
jgi:hypothetical protein